MVRARSHVRYLEGVLIYGGHKRRDKRKTSVYNQDYGFSVFEFYRGPDLKVAVTADYPPDQVEARLAGYAATLASKGYILEREALPSGLKILWVLGWQLPAQAVSK
jgi:hypothetical protein